MFRLFDKLYHLYPFFPVYVSLSFAALLCVYQNDYSLSNTILYIPIIFFIHFHNLIF